MEFPMSFAWLDQEIGTWYKATLLKDCSATHDPWEIAEKAGLGQSWLGSGILSGGDAKLKGQEVEFEPWWPTVGHKAAMSCDGGPGKFWMSKGNWTDSPSEVIPECDPELCPLLVAFQSSLRISEDEFRIPSLDFHETSEWPDNKHFFTWAACPESLFLVIKSPRLAPILPCGIWGFEKWSPSPLPAMSVGSLPCTWQIARIWQQRDWLINVSVA